MERSLIKQVNQKNMTARLRTNKVKPVYYPNFFGMKKKTSLKWETLVGEKGAPVIADVISFDASAPQKTREVISKMSGDIPKTAVKRGMNESEYNEYKQLVRDAQNDSDQLEILNLAFKDQDFVYNAVRGRFEWWSMQLMSRGGFLLNAANNAGVVTAEFVGCGMPSENKLVADTNWDTSATADGIADIEAAVEAADAKGIELKYAIMRNDEFLKLKKQAATIARIKGWKQLTSNVVANKETINQYLEAEGLPTIVIVRPSVRIEDKSHKRTTVNPWESRRVTLVPDLSIGDVQHGPIAAETSEAVKKKAITTKRDFVFLQKWSTLDPFKEWTMAEANAIPVINDPESMWIIKADGVAWSGTEDTEGTDNVPAYFLGEEVTEE
jgi:hypothetical protein